jgi:hypothetical protein
MILLNTISNFKTIFFKHVTHNPFKSGSEIGIEHLLL